MIPVALEVVAAFTNAAVTAFEEMTQTSVVPVEPRLGQLPTEANFSAAIRLLREQEGLVIVAVPKAVLTVLASRYLPNAAPNDALLADLAGEFANVIAGQAKTMLKETAYHFRLSTPQSVNPHEVKESQLLTFESDVGPIFLVLDLRAVVGDDSSW
jgi:CheY-specific phosphatase CheX